MKLTSLKFIVVLMVVLAVSSKRVFKSATLNKVLTRLDAMADASAYCEDGRSGAPQGMWLKIDTNSINNGNSGFIVRNYYKSEAFTCKYMNKISNQDSRNRYFASYRDFSSYNGAYSDENSWTKMRQLIIYMKQGNYVFNIDKFLIQSSSISASELTSIVTKLHNRKNSYLTDYRNYRNKMSSIKVQAEQLTSLKAKNLNTKAALQAEVSNKRAEITITQETLKDLMAKAEASRLQIRNYDREINAKRNGKLKEEMDNLKAQVTGLDALEAQIADNEKKIQGIVPIDHSDLTASMTTLKEKLNLLKNTYLASDPKSMEFSTMIAHLEQMKDNIPQLLA